MFKRIVAAVVATAGVVICTHGQGTINFDTSSVGAQVTDAAEFGGGLVGAVVPQGTNFFAQLYALAGTGHSSADLLPVGNPVNFNSGSVSGGYVQTSGTNTLGQLVNQTVTITNGGVSAGGPVTVQLRAWWGGGTQVVSYEAASVSTNLTVRFGQSPALNLSATGNPSSTPPGFPADLIGLQSFQLYSWYVSPLPAISTQPLSQTNSAGATASFNAWAIGAAPLSYQWQKDAVPLTNGGNVSGATTTTLTLSNVQAADATSYTVVVTNAAGSATSSVAALAVVIAPLTTVQPAGRTNNAGTTATFTVLVMGATPLSYQWQKGAVPLANGGNVSGADSATLALSNVLKADEGNYSVVITNAAGSTLSSNAALSVIEPAIATPPASRTNNAGTIATFNVVAGGTAPLSYQWAKGGVNLINGGTVSGAGSATLTLANLQDADAGSYTVVITNTYGSATSSPPATLTVIDPPTITIHPASRTNNAGTTAIFTVSATGTAPLSYQWKQHGFFNLSDGGNISGANSATLIISSVSIVDEDTYNVVITNVAGSAVSSDATLTVNDPAITTQPASRTNNAGTTATFTVSAAGTEPLTYQWQKGGSDLTDGGNVSGATTSMLTVANVLKADEAGYSVEVFGAAGTAVSSDATLTVVDPIITTQPANRTNTVGTTATFTVGAAGTAPLRYQWKKGGFDLVNGGNVSGADSATLTLINVQASDAASYTAVVTNVAGSATSSPPATLTVLNAPLITTQPASRTNDATTIATFTVTASGNTPLSYRWRKGGVNLNNDTRHSGVTNNTLSVSNVLNADEGNYSVLITNTLGSDLSSDAILTVIDPAITNQPLSITNAAGTTNTFTVYAGGTTPPTLKFQWQKNGVKLSNGGHVSGAALMTLTLKNVSQADAANYTVVVTNSQGAATSAPPATLVVIDPPAITTQPVSRTNNAGTTATFTVNASGTAPTYQWRKGGVNLSNGGNVSGATASTLTLTNVAQSDVAGYTVVVSNFAASVTSSPPATLTVIDPPAITAQPLNRTNNAGTTAAFTVTASGTAPGYQWRKGGVNMSNGGNVSGATTSTLTLTNVAQSDAAGYTVVLTNAAGSITSAPPATLTVIDPPVITTQPLSLTNNAGATAIFTVTASGTAPGYQWRKGAVNLTDGGNVSGSTGDTLTLTNVAQSDAAGYTVIVTNAAGSVTSSPPATLTVIDPPAITTQPLNRTNNAGTTAAFTVTASGTAPGYQWRKGGVNMSNGGNVSGVTTSTLTLTNVTQSDAAGYTVVLTNAAGSITSAPPATLTVIDPPVITTQPLSLTNNAGATAIFTVTASGTAPGYQWRKGAVNLTDGGNVSGSTGDTLTLTNVTQSDAASYTVIVTNAAGSVTSSPPATLTVIDPPAITAQPLNRTNNAGTTAAFTVTASGTAPGYQWRKGGVNMSNGGNVSGATTSTLTLTNVAQSDAAGYTVVLTNAAGSITSAPPATLTVIDPPVITTQPLSLTNNAGATAIFTVTASGTAPGYQWRKGAVNLTDGGNVSGSTGDTLTLTNVAQSDAAGYTVIVTNAAGSVTSSPPATLTVIDPPAITAQPLNRTNNAGTTAAFTVTASGTAPGYQWRKGGVNMSNGGNVSGVTTSTLTLTNVAQSDAAGYTVVLTNAAGSITSAPPATLTVIDPPVITTQPLSQTNNAGATAIFTVTASGTAPGYQWRKGAVNLTDGGNVSGSTGDTLTLTNVAQSDAAGYTVIVTNAAGSVTSSPPATLTVIDPPAITTQPLSRTNNAGTTAAFTVTASGTPPLSYQWKKGGMDLADAGNVSGSDSATLTISNELKADENSYSVVITNAAGLLASSNATLTVIDPVITAQPASQTNDPETTATFAVSVTGTLPLGYQWQKGGVGLINGGSISGADTATLTLSSVTKTDEGSYSVVITNSAGSAVSSNATLSVIGLVITVQPQSQTVPAGSNVTLTVVAPGTPAPDYQWFFNSVLIPGAAQASLTVTNFQAPNEGNYCVGITNDFGSLLSDTATLYLDAPLRFVNSHVNRDGFFQTRLLGLANSNRIIQTSTNLTSWIPLITNNTSNGIIDFTDTNHVGFADPNNPDYRIRFYRFYRAWLAP